MAGFQRQANLLLEPACAKAWAEYSLAYSVTTLLLLASAWTTR